MLPFFLGTFSCLFYLPTYLHCGPCTALQVVVGFCPKRRATIRAGGIRCTDLSKTAQQPLAEIPACLAGLCAQIASISCWLPLQLYSLLMCEGLPIREFYILGTGAKCWSKSLPTNHTTLNNFRSLITEEIIRRRKCVDLSSCLP